MIKRPSEPMTWVLFFVSVGLAVLACALLFNSQPMGAIGGWGLFVLFVVSITLAGFLFSNSVRAFFASRPIEPGAPAA